MILAQAWRREDAPAGIVVHADAAISFGNSIQGAPRLVVWRGP